jgi:hypothetical protein
MFDRDPFQQGTTCITDNADSMLMLGVQVKATGTYMSNLKSKGHLVLNMPCH